MAGLDPVESDTDAWATAPNQAILALNDGFVPDQTLNNATGVLTTNATWASNTTFTVVGDATAFYLPGRRLKVVHAGGTTYCEVLSAVFAAGSTTVTITQVTSGPATMTAPITSAAVGLESLGLAGNGVQILKGTTAQRPPAGAYGRLYFNTDLGALQRDTGAAWDTVAAPYASPFVVTAADATLTNEKVLGTAVLMRGTMAARPAAGTEGRFYASTDETPNTLYRDNGASWDAIGFVDPTTTRGDILVRTAAGLTRLALGGASTYLKSDGTDAGWAALAVDVSIVTGIKRPYKTADETVAVSTVLQNDDHLFFAIGANEVWHFEIVLRITTTGGNPSGEFNMDFTTPAGATGHYIWIKPGGGGSVISFATVQGITVGVNADVVVLIEGVVINGGTAGTFQLRWAQTSAFAGTSVIVRAGSAMVATRVS